LRDLTGLLRQSIATSVESLWNNNHHFFVYGVITADPALSHIHRVRIFSPEL
jgi:hypothetical protein